MARRNQLARIAQGTYLVLPPGARSVGQIADRRLLVSAAFEGRWTYYLGFLSAIADHGLTDESVTDLHVALAGRRLPQMKELAGRPVRMTRVAFDAEDSWLGIERQRIRGKMFYVRSGLERTLVDALDRPELCDRPEVWVRAWERAFRDRDVDLPLLLELAQRRSHASSARAALLLRELGRPREARLLLRSPVTGRVMFDAANPSPPGRPPRDRETGLVMNVPLEAVGAWLEYGK